MGDWMGVGQAVAPAALKPWIAAAQGVEAWRGRDERERQYREALGRAEKARAGGGAASEADLAVLAQGMPPTPGKQAAASVGNYMGALKAAQLNRQQAIQNALKAGAMSPGAMSSPMVPPPTAPLRPLSSMLPTGGAGVGGESNQMEQLLKILMLSGWGQGQSRGL